MRLRIEVWTTRRTDYRIRKLKAWIRNALIPVAGWAMEAVMWIGIAGMMFFACGADSVDLDPVVKGLLISAGITEFAAASKWVLREIV